MLQILSVTFPFFALVLCGFFAAKRGMLPLAAIGGMNSFVLFFALPCMLYRFGASTPIALLLDPQLALIYLVCALVMVLLLVLLTLNVGQGGRIDWNDAAFGALVGSFPNTGFMGVPLLVALFGNNAAGPAIITIVVDMVITTSLCIALSRLGNTQGGAWQAAKNALRGVVSNPMPWSILVGGLSSAYALQLPQPIAATVGLLADSASPVALFTIGAVMARSHMLVAHDAAHAVPWQDYVPVALIKLVVHPLLVLGAGVAAIVQGIALDRFALTIVVLVAALPSASNVVLLSERFNANSGRIARIILVSTVAAFFTFSASVSWLTPR